MWSHILILSPLARNKFSGWRRRWDKPHIVVHLTSLQPLLQKRHDTFFLLFLLHSSLWVSIKGLHGVHSLAYVSWDGTKRRKTCFIVFALGMDGKPRAPWIITNLLSSLYYLKRASLLQSTSHSCFLRWASTRNFNTWEYMARLCEMGTTSGTISISFSGFLFSHQD
jgi:hypothetical protein